MTLQDTQRAGKHNNGPLPGPGSTPKTFDNRLLFTKQVSLIGSTMGSRSDFTEAMEFIFQHKIRIPIDTVTPLSEGIKMIKRLEDGQQYLKRFRTTEFSLNLQLLMTSSL